MVVHPGLNFNTSRDAFWGHLLQDLDNIGAIPNLPMPGMPNQDNAWDAWLGLLPGGCHTRNVLLLWTQSGIACYAVPMAFALQNFSGRATTISSAQISHAGNFVFVKHLLISVAGDGTYTINWEGLITYSTNTSQVVAVSLVVKAVTTTLNGGTKVAFKNALHTLAPGVATTNLRDLEGEDEDRSIDTIFVEVRAHYKKKGQSGKVEEALQTALASFKAQLILDHQDVCRLTIDDWTKLQCPLGLKNHVLFYSQSKIY